MADFSTSILADEIKRRAREVALARVRQLQQSERLIATRVLPPLPSMRDWLASHYHLGSLANPPGSKGGIYSLLRDHLIEIFADPRIWLIMLLGGVGYGKTKGIALPVMLRCLQETASLPSIQDAAGIMQHSTVTYYAMNRTEMKAQTTLYAELYKWAQSIQFFREHCQPDTNFKKRLAFPHGVTVWPVGGSPLNIKSDDVAGGSLDEVNDWPIVEHSKRARGGLSTYDAAVQTLDEIETRMRSRFALPGDGSSPAFPAWCKVVVLSQAKSPDDAIERMAADRKGDPGVYVVRHATWDTKPAGTYCGKRFTVAVPQVGRSPFLVDSPSDRARAETEGCELHEVPVEFREPFVRAPAAATAELLGVARIATEQWIDLRSWDRCVALRTERGMPGNLGPEISIGLEDGWEPDQALLRDGRWPILNPECPRYVRVDLGVSGDPVGLSMGHVAGRVRTRRWSGAESAEAEAPIVCYDLAVRIVPPPRGKIRLSRVRHFIIALREQWGYPVVRVTYDHFESEESRQELEAAGFDVACKSVMGSMEAWVTIRDALEDGRALLPDVEAIRGEADLFVHDRKKDRLVFDRTRASHRAHGDPRLVSHGDVVETMAGVMLDCAGAAEDMAAWPVATVQRPQQQQVQTFAVPAPVADTPAPGDARPTVGGAPRPAEPARQEASHSPRQGGIRVDVGNEAPPGLSPRDRRQWEVRRLRRERHGDPGLPEDLLRWGAATKRKRY